MITMGDIHKINDEYYIEFMARGLKYQQKAGRDYDQAVRLLKEVEDKINRGELLTIVREVALDVFCQQFLQTIRAEYSGATYRRFEGIVSHLQIFLSKDKPDIKKLSQLTPLVIERYKKHLIAGRRDAQGGFNPKIVNFNLLLLRELLEYGIKTGYINDNPTLHVRLLPAPSAAGFLFVNQAESGRLFAVAPLQVKICLRLMSILGLRAEETALIDSGWIDRTGMCIRVPGAFSRSIPFVEEAQRLIQDKLPMSSAELCGEIRRALLLADLPHKSVQVCRHTFAARLLQSGVSWFRVYKILGLSDCAEMMIYSRYIPLSRDDMYLGTASV